MTKPPRKPQGVDGPRGGSRRSAGAADAAGFDPLQALCTGAVVLLIVARWLVPTEAADEGATLWLAQLTLGVGLVWVWREVRMRTFALRFGWLDAAAMAIVAGHVASALHVVLGEGNKRAAVNLMWEWISLGVLFLLLRQWLTTRATARRMAGVLLTTAVVLAALGIWQHFVFYPQAAREYDRNRAELDRLLSAPPAASPQEAAARRNRLRDLQAELFAQGVPLEGPARQLYEQRLRSSTEPFGLFGLANSFAGLLLVGLFAALAAAEHAWRGGAPRARLAAAGAAVLLVGYCLVLTKSRTAWVGLLVGLGLWGLLRLLQRGDGKRGVRVGWIVGGLALLGALFAGAAVSGGLDAAVFSEAPKSLRFRLQYWRGAAAVVREDPIWGVGPGNFRDHYLRHKLPESSEEIADPHNFLLDLWTSGGVIAVAGLAAFLAGALFLQLRPAGSATAIGADDADNAPRGVAASARRDPLAWGAIAAFPAVVLADFIAGRGIDERLVVLGIGWLGSAWLLFDALDRPPRAASADVIADESANRSAGAFVLAALAALMVHLTGAGGMEMPAIVQTIFLLAAMIPAMRGLCGGRPANARGPFLGAAALMAASFIGCLFTATLPVVSRQGYVSTGDSILALGGSAEQAEQAYRAAADADPLSPEPYDKLAELTYRRWREAPKKSDDVIARAIELKRQSIDRNPFRPHGYIQLGEWQIRKFERSLEDEDAEAALAAYATAVERYPNYAELRSKRAEALAKSGRGADAAKEAARALELDEINRAEGHVELYLPATRVDALRKLAGPGG